MLEVVNSFLFKMLKSFFLYSLKNSKLYNQFP